MPLTYYDKMVSPKEPMEDGKTLYSYASVYSILKRLKEYEDTGATPQEVLRYKEAYELLKLTSYCNTCLKQEPCEYAVYTSWGDPVVYRCPHYEPEETDDERND